MRRSTKRSSCLRDFRKIWNLGIWKLRFSWEFRISITSISLRGLNKWDSMFSRSIFLLLHGCTVTSSHIWDWVSVLHVHEGRRVHRFQLKFRALDMESWKTLPETHILRPKKLWGWETIRLPFCRCRFSCLSFSPSDFRFLCSIGWQGVSLDFAHPRCC